MKKVAIILFLATISIASFGQKSPEWLDESSRNANFPTNAYLTGFASRVVEKDILETTQQAKTDAQADLVKQVRLIIKSKTQTLSSAQSVNGKYDEKEGFENQTSAEANAEITGMKTETWFDKKAKLVYAFAYANKSELIGYYKSNLSVNVNQIESFVKTAQDLEANGEKVKARQQLEMTKPTFQKVHYQQELLTVLDGSATSDDLLQPKTDQLYNTITQLLAKLAQGIYVFVESRENLFGQQVDIVANKLKAELAVNGCSFVENADSADFKLTINVSTRYSSNDGDIAYCYANSQLQLYSRHKQKVVYSDEIAQKSGGVSQDKAGRRAMGDLVPIIFEKLKPWIEN